MKLLRFSFFLFLFLGATPALFAQGFMSDEADADGWEPEYLEDISPISAQPQAKPTTSTFNNKSRVAVTVGSQQSAVSSDVQSEAKKAEEAKKADDIAKAEAKRKADALAIAEAKKADDIAKAQAKRAADIALAADEAKKADDIAKAEAKQKADALAAEAKKADDIAKAEAKQKADALSAEAKKADDIAKAEAKQKTDALAAEAKKADDIAKAEAKRKVDALAAEAKKADDIAKAEAKRKADVLAAAEAKKADDMAKAEAKQKADALAAEAKKADDIAKAALPKVDIRKEMEEAKAAVVAEPIVAKPVAARPIVAKPAAIVDEPSSKMLLPEKEILPNPIANAPNMLISGQKITQTNNTSTIYAPKPAVRNASTNGSTLNVAKTTIYDLVADDRTNYQTAYQYFVANNFEEAKPYLERIVANKKSFADGYRMLVECYEDKKQYKKAIDAFEKYLELQPNNEKDWYNISLLYAKNDQLELAITACERAMSMKPDYVKAERRLLALYGATNNTAALADKKDANSLYQLAVIETRTGKLAEAIATVDKMPNPTADALYLKAANLRKLNKEDEAVEIYKKVIALNPNHIDAHAELGIILYNKEDFEQAALSLGIAQSLKISDTQLAFFYGKALVMTSEMKRAITYLERVVTAQPTNAEARKFLDIAYANVSVKPSGTAAMAGGSDNKVRIQSHNEGIKALADNDPYTAITMLTKALEKDQKQPATAYALGLAYLEVKETDKALAAFKKSLAADPNYLKAHEGIAKTYFNMHNGEAAIAAYEQVLKQKDGKTAQNYKELATTYAMMENPTKALEYFKIATTIEGDNPTTLYNMGTTALQANKFNEAIGYFDKAILLKPNGLAAYYNKGQALLKLEQTDKALALGETMIKINPDYANGYLLCALVYSKLNDTMNQVKYERIAEKLAGR
jgi:tetratricopeptide (TPR) repeat protein